MANRVFKDSRVLSNGMILLLALLLTHIGVSSSLSLRMVLSARPPQPPTQSSAIRGLNVPTVRLSRASSRGVNAVFTPRDPKTIPTGFSRMCNKAGGFAPRPVWDEITNGITPWFESNDGHFIYFNCNDAYWYVDNASGAGLYLARPVGSLLLPPTSGWTHLTGRRIGAPKMSFVELRI